MVRSLLILAASAASASAPADLPRVEAEDGTAWQVRCYMLYEILPATPKSGRVHRFVGQGRAWRAGLPAPPARPHGRALRAGPEAQAAGSRRKLGTSVTPVREALARLVSDLVLVQVDYRSVCVAVMDLRQVRRSSRVAARCLKAGRGACGRMRNAGRYRRLENNPCAAGRCAGTRLLSGYPAGEPAFHLSLCRAARMPMLLGLVEALWVQCGPLMHGMTRWPVVRPNKHPHVAIIEALESATALRRGSRCSTIS